MNAKTTNREEIGEKFSDLLSKLDGWAISETGKLRKVFGFKAFNDGLEFVNRVAEVADRLDHHPDVFLVWGRVELEIITHCGNTLTEKDFNLAREIDSLVSALVSAPSSEASTAEAALSLAAAPSSRCALPDPRR